MHTQIISKLKKRYILSCFTFIIIFCVVIPLFYVLVGCTFQTNDLLINKTKKYPDTTYNSVSDKTNILRIREESNSIFTFPEWDIVYISQEFADFQKKHLAHEFNYLKAITQYWQGYKNICIVSKGNYDFNFEFHTKLTIIGVSHTLEYFIKGIYESTIGRFTSYTVLNTRVSEYDYIQQVNEDYGLFLNEIPFFKYPYFSKIAGIWTDQSLFRLSISKKLERKLIFTLEYALKGSYGKIMEFATKNTFGFPDNRMLAITNTFDDNLIDINKFEIVILERTPNYYIIELPRYSKFTEIVKNLSDNLIFYNIAGNESIFITVLNSEPNLNFSTSDISADVIFIQSTLGNDKLYRYSLIINVADLNALVQRFGVEHVYDY